MLNHYYLLINWIRPYTIECNFISSLVNSNLKPLKWLMNFWYFSLGSHLNPTVGRKPHVHKMVLTIYPRKFLFPKKHQLTKIWRQKIPPTEANGSSAGFEILRNFACGTLISIEFFKPESFFLCVNLIGKKHLPIFYLTRRIISMV